MKIVKINSLLLKNVAFILIYLSLLSYPLNTLTHALMGFGTSASLTRLYERFYLGPEFFLIVVLVMGLMLVYAILFFLLNFYRYVKLFFETFTQKELWIILISNRENADLNLGEIKEQSSTDEEHIFKRCIRSNFYCLILLYVISIAISFLLAFTSSIIG